MACGIPFCHQGCPVNNIIPDWSDLVYKGDWAAAIAVLHSTNNFPEFTGRICPAPCEAACTLNIGDAPVAIKTIEYAIVDKAWEQGWIKPQVPERRTGKRVAVVGSGPAGLAGAEQLARAGHQVSVFEKQDCIGGLLRYGIPDFKLSKKLIDWRQSQMRTEGVEFHTYAHVGRDIQDVYRRPYDPQRPVICLDEQPTQLIGETRVPLPIQPGQVPRYDYEYERLGATNHFMIVEPLAGWRNLSVRETKTALDLTQEIKELADVHCLGRPPQRFPNRYRLAVHRCRRPDHRVRSKLMRPRR